MRALLAITLLATGTAQARSSSPSYPETDQDKQDDATIVQAEQDPQFEGSVGFELGTFHTGPVYNFAYGLALDGGVRIDRLALLGNYAFLGLANPNSGTYSSSGGADFTTDTGASTSSPPTGFVQRFGAAARYSIAKGGLIEHGFGVRVDTWFEAGLGEQMLRWSGGGYLHRPDVELALGFQLNMRGTRRHGGFFMGIRVTLADPPKMSGPAPLPTCAGPCDGPTGPIGVDRSILFVTAIDFGT